MLEKLPTRKKSTNSYAIRNKEGQWASGGSYSPKWNDYPKVWAPGPFKNHLHLFLISGWSLLEFHGPDFFYHGLIKNDWPYIGCQIVEVNQNLEITKTLDAVDWAWSNVYKPHLLKSPYSVKCIEAWATKHGIINPLL